MSPFRVLYREFLFRVVDLDIVGERGDAQRLLVQFAALLAGISFTAALSSLQFAFTKGSPAEVLIRTWPSQHFLIASTMLITGIFTLLAWDQLFLDRRDVFVLAPLPLPIRTIFFAKLAAVATALGAVILTANCFTALAYPLHFVPVGGGFVATLRTFAAWWITVGAASAFLACSLIALQGLLAQTLSRPRFLRWSAWAQIAAFCLILTVYFLQPILGTPAQFAAPHNQTLLERSPSYWFFGLFHVLNGDGSQIHAMLAKRAAAALSLSIVLAIALFLTSYLRTIRRTAEQPDIVPQNGRQRGGGFRLDFIGNSAGIAIALFAARCVARSRQHRVILAGYLGTGSAIALAYLNSLQTGRAADPWWRVNIPMLVANIVLICFAVVGIRALFDLPLAVRSNWAFRITELRPAREYLIASWVALFVMAVAPALIIAAAVLISIWPLAATLQHLVWLALFGAILTSFATKNLSKIPFTCTYLPGKANLHVMAGAYIMVLTLFTDVAARFEQNALVRGPASYLKFAAFTAAIAVWLWCRTRETWRTATLQFEDEPEQFVLQFVPKR